MEEFKEILNTYLKDCHDVYSRESKIGALFNSEWQCSCLVSSSGKDIELVEKGWGGEEKGEYCYGILRFEDKYFKAEWSYYSYDGADFDGIESTIKEVTPVEKTVIVYE